MFILWFRPLPCGPLFRITILVKFGNCNFLHLLANITRTKWVDTCFFQTGPRWIISTITFFAILNLTFFCLFDSLAWFLVILLVLSICGCTASDNIVKSSILKEIHTQCPQVVARYSFWLNWIGLAFYYWTFKIVNSCTMILQWIQLPVSQL